jgi:hypothetical protein
MRNYILDEITENLPGLELRIIRVNNSLFGNKVGVSGLIAGRDILDTIRKEGNVSGCLVLPPNCVNHEGIMIDGYEPSGLAGILGVNVVIPEHHFLEKKVLRSCRGKIE